MDDFLNGIPSIFRDDLIIPAPRQSVPVNITETENDYVLELVAPGMEKEDFKIHLENSLLTISANKKAEASNGKEIIKEYKFQPFKRSFTVDETIDTENLVAKYLNGVLTLNLRKKAEVKEAAKQITIE